MARLSKNVAVRRGGNPVVLVAGQELPDWAVDLVDDNVLEQAVEPAGDGGDQAGRPVEGDEPKRGRSRRTEA